MSKIRLDNVTVQYPIYNAVGMSLRSNLLAVSTGGRLAREARRVVSVTALDGITIDLNDGDRIGLVGHNGSGKTTLLRTIAGIFEPTAGSITVEGRVSTVFGLGAGMEEELSGFENIIRMAMMLGATRAQAETTVPDVEEFTELGDFLSVPVRTYSAGMKTRLLFAVATSVHPDILLVDEVLGAGDAEFQEKARQRMASFVEKASIFVLASHSAELIKTYSHKVIRLEHGRIKEIANAPKGD